MRHVIASLAFLFCLSALPGCDGKTVPVAAPDPGSITALSDVPVARVENEKTWRIARELPPGRSDLSLGSAVSGCVLRFAILTGASDVRATAFYKAEIVWTKTFKAGLSWQEIRQTLRQIDVDAPVVLTLESEFPVHLASAELIAPPGFNPRVRERPNVVVYLIDTLRQDHLEPYGYPLETSPNIAAFAEDGAYVQHLVPMSSWTRASVASLFTGVHTNTHGAEEIPDRLRPNLPGLAIQLQANGYETHGLITNPNCIPEYGFGDGFDDYRDIMATTQRPGWQRDEATLTAAQDIVRNAAGRPFYLYVHTMAPHRDYDAPDKYSSKFLPNHYVGSRLDARYQREMALYDGEILFSDMIFGKLMDTLKEEDLYDDTLIVLLSDHGEAFNEHGELGHGMTLFDEEVKIPCIIKLPRAKPLRPRIGSQVHMVDIAPTILDLLGVPRDPRFEGVSFASLLTGSGTFSEVSGFLELRINDRHRFAARTRALKYVYNVESHTFAWYRSTQDKGEHFPLLTPPKPGGEELRRFAHLESMRGAPGLHVRANWTTRRPRVTLDIGIGAEGPDNVYVSKGRTRIERSEKLLRVHWENDDPPGPWAHQPVEFFAHVENAAEADTFVSIMDADGASVPLETSPPPASRINDRYSWPSDSLVVTDLGYVPPQESGAGGLDVAVWRLPAKVVPVDEQEETLEALKSLGYLE